MWPIALLLLTIAFIVAATSKLKLHPFLALLLAAFGYGILCGQMALADVIESINDGFGGTVGHIGIVILAGSVIGTFLDKSGGALRLAERTVQLVGRKNVSLAMGIIGYIVSIPVFCDSAFILLSPLGKSLASKAKVPLATAVMALSLGLYATHTMVPPTPGPVAAAGLLGADLGKVILLGLLVSIPALLGSWLFSVKFASRIVLDSDSAAASELVPAPAADAPSAGKSLVPILLPIVLILARSVSNAPNHPLGEGRLAEIIQFMGQPAVALLIGVFLAFLLPRKLTAQMLSPSGWIGEAVMAAATIIVITGCGGAFGKVLQNSQIADVVSRYLGDGAAWGVWLPFLLAAAIKTAQGSSTVAIITTAGIVAPMLEPLGLAAPTGRALAVVAIGAGAMVVSHANDSYFWIVTQLSGMSVPQGYRLQTLGTLIEGAIAALTVWIVSVIVL
ncbi:MAG: GntP family permease [Phycisphaerales bacterium]|nr:MAG: GntP family permease [Phycisphaerales bacterium]